MKLSCELKKSVLSRAKCDLVVNGEVVVTLQARNVPSVELPPRERYYVTLGHKVYSAITVLIPESDNVHLYVTERNKSFSFDVAGGRLEVISLSRLLGALCDEGQIPYLEAWEKTAFFAMLYIELDREDAILESPFLLEIREALAEIGEGELADRLLRAMEACEIALPLAPMKKLTPEEETALIESYHILWNEAESAPKGEERHLYLSILDYIYEHREK